MGHTQDTLGYQLARFVGLSAILLIAACGGEKMQSVQTKPQKLSAVDTDDANPNAMDSTDPNGMMPDGDLLHTTYAMVIRSKLFNMEMCKGDIELKVALKAGVPAFEFPQGMVECMFGIKLDVAKMLSGVGAPQTGAAAQGPGIKVDGKVIRLEGIGEAKFAPARPFLISVFAEKPENLRGFSVSDSITASELKTGKSASGTVGLNVLQVNETISNEHFRKPFDKVLRWEITAEGFDGVNKATMFLFDKVEFAFNLDPIAIPKMQIVGKLKDFMAAAPGSTGASALGSLSSIGSTGGGGLFGGVLGGFIGGATGSGGGSGLGGILGGLVGAIAGNLTVDLTLKQQSGIE